MKKILVLLSLFLLAGSVTAQLRFFNSVKRSSTITPSSTEFTLYGSTIVFDGAQTKAHPKPGLNLYTNNFLYDPTTKNSYCFFRLNIADYYARPYILPYVNGIGIDRPVAIGRALGNTLDDHARPSGIIVNSRLRVLGENVHNTPLFNFKANFDDDFYSFSEDTQIGTKQSYQEIHKLEDGSYYVFGQIDDSFPGGNKSDVNFENWGSDVEFALGGGGNQRYPTSPSASGEVQPSGYTDLIVTNRPGDTWRQRYRLRTADAVTFWNSNLTFSDTFIDDTDLTNYLYWETVAGGGSGDGFIPVPTVWEDNFFDAGYKSSLADYVFIYKLANESTYTERALGLTDYVHDLELEIRQQGAVVQIVVRSLTDIRIFVRQNPDTYTKIYQYKTEDLGQTWELIGDVFPDVDGDIGDFRIPNNYADIPDNTNFFAYGSELVAGDPSVGLANIYLRKCSFGDLQPESLNPFDSVEAMTFSEYNAKMVRSYFVQDAYITKTGSAITSFIDQSPSGLSATPSATGPTYNSDDGTYASFNGTNQAINLNSPTDILAMQEGIVFVLAKKDTQVNNICSFINGSNSANAGKRVFFGCNKGGVLNNAMFMENRQVTATWTTYGDQDIGNDWHLFVFLCSEQRSSTIWTDGLKQWYNWNQTTTSNWNNTGLFFNNTGVSMNRVEIGKWLAGTNTFFDFKLKHVGIAPLMSYTDLMAAMKFLAGYSNHNITLVSSFQ